MHDADPDRVVLTGAMVYDQWFARRASTTRDEFCARVGLDPARPILLYLCSSPFIAPDEVVFIEQWIASDPIGAGCARPNGRHPDPPASRESPAVASLRRDGASRTFRCGHAAVPARSMPRRSNDFFDSMYHSAGAVGINTSAQIECGIVGRPVFSIRTPAYRRTQDGTLHFRHLTSEGGGLLRLADDFDTHVRQIAAAFDDPEGTRRQIEGFVRAFTRPYGLDVEATPRMVEEIERLDASPAPAPRGLPLYAYPLRALLYPIAVVMAIVRRVTRVSRKRSRQLRPVTATGTLVQDDAGVFDWLFRFRPIRNFAKQHIVPRAVSRLSAVDAPTEEAVAVPRVLQRIERKRPPDHRRPVGERGRLRASLLDPVSQLGDDPSSVQRRSPRRRLAWRVRSVVSRHRDALRRALRLLHTRGIPAAAANSV